MKVAIIDCGTNTFNLLVAKVGENHDYEILADIKKCVKLMHGGNQEHKISPDAFKRGIDAFVELFNKAHRYKPDSVKSFATSAIRTSVNGPEFVNKIFNKTGVIIQVINGDTEAQYIYKGVNLALKDNKIPSLIMDIGGGSTEFILSDQQSVVWKRSFELGAARLLDDIRPANPLNRLQNDALLELLNNTLEPLREIIKKHPVSTLIGCSGSFESVAHIISSNKRSEPEMSPLVKIEEEDFEFVFNDLICSTEEERLNMPGLVNFRVDTIVFAAVFIKYIKETIGINQLFYSSYSLKEGILSDMINQNIPV